MSFEKKPLYQAPQAPFQPPPPAYTAVPYPYPNAPVQPPQHANHFAYTESYPQNFGTAAAPQPIAAPFPQPTTFSPPPALRVFPATINGYYSWKSSTTIYLGPSKDTRTHALKVHDSLFSSKQTLALHAGPGTGPEHAVMASVQSRGYKDKEFVVTASGAAMGGSDAVVQVHGVKTSMMSEAARFEVDVGYGRVEAFEWRSSHGEDIKEVATGSSFGWKLVRLSEHGGPTGMGRGFANDGKEIVAVVAHNASWSASKGLRFAFLGSGLAGAFGEVWEVVAMASGLKLWYKDVEHMASAASG
ncbi:uncharacterized protein BKCO1_7500030 [Diplodia corticola]|uniref:Uncharacterized protein n=1 Tax=Diplodia corticola TaxID=236234 RepID=A0A1J9RB71_9PEZI|nr:uncharacterized protein BKCO1_7500030 [Diplodia corticola]OJD29675.1 hypothetical protein BKCO1_7500030 [Diplodia corticola]